MLSVSDLSFERYFERVFEPVSFCVAKGTLLLDEPYSNLDQDGIAMLNGILQKHLDNGGLSRVNDSLMVGFDVNDGAASVAVVFDGILPDLFREGQGIIAIGELTPDGHFEASEVLAKHDENYMPPEVADALARAGHPGAENGQ